MSALALIVAGLLALILAPAFGFMAMIVIAAARARLAPPAVAPSESVPGSRFLILIPAHDEAGVVGTTVRSCRGVAYDPDLFQVCVIADNCGDGTAAEAAAAGAVVVARHDPARKSKGFALDDFFRGAIGSPALRPCDAFVLVDADTSVARDLLVAFDRDLRRGDDFIQGYYTVRNADASWRTRLMTCAFGLANGVWPLGMDRSGLSVGLKGNGMCFRASALGRFPWRAHGLVEDMEFAWQIRLAGGRVRFDPAARVYGEMVSRGGAGAASQRRRWESGRRTLRATFRRAIWRSPHLSWPAKLAYAVDLDFPPLSRLAVISALATGLIGVGMAGPASRSVATGIAGVLAAYWAILAIYALSPVPILELPTRYLLSFAYLPYYIAWKGFVGLLKAPTRWVRTPRENAS